jgi:hypothetical protein
MKVDEGARFVCGITEHPAKLDTCCARGEGRKRWEVEGHIGLLAGSGTGVFMEASVCLRTSHVIIIFHV